MIPVSIVFVAKLLASIFLYYHLGIKYQDTYWMSIDTAPNWPQNTVFWLTSDQTPRWLYLFLGWDSAWYLSIMTKGYSFSTQSYAFFPGLPVFGYLFNLVFKVPILSIWICTSIFGLLWIPIYQAISEKYMKEREAMISTLIFAFSPYIFLFTTMVYTEGLFLFFTLLTWYYYQKKKFNKTILFASISTLVRPVGFLIVIPIIIDILKDDENHRFTRVLKNSLPIMTLLLWFFYFKTTFDDWLAPLHTSEWDAMYTFSEWVFKIIPEHGVNALLFPVPWLEPHFISPFFILFSLILPPIFIVLLIRRHDVLGYYSLFYYGAILYIGTVFSFPRFLSFLFPVWMLGSSKLVNKKVPLIVFVLIVLIFFVLSLSLWKGFLSGLFIA